jgi:hypothetical protein
MAPTSANPARAGGARQQFLQCNDDATNLSDQTPDPRVPIKAVLSGTRHCSALGISVNAYTPVASLARQLVRAGFHPDRLIEVYRGTTLRFRVSLATAARLTVKDGSDGIPRFRLHPQRVATGSSVEPTLVPLPLRAIHAPGKLVPCPAPVKRDGLADLRRLGRMRRLAEAS